MKKTLLLALIPLLSGCGLLFVNGPPSGWQEIQDPDHLEMISITQPCTNSRALVFVDGGLAVLNVIGGVQALTVGVDGFDEDQAKDWAAFSFVWAGVETVAALSGNGRISNCRAFNARVLELREGSSSNLTSHEWLDELSPPPDLGVAAFDPVFGLPFNLADGS